MNVDNVTYFDGFGVEHNWKEIKKLIGNKNITKNIFRIQAYNSIICRYFCMGFIDFMLKGKSFYTNKRVYQLIFSKYEVNDKIILKCFQ